MVADNVDQINPSGGFVRYGNVKNSYIVVKGSVMGPAKRLIHLSLPRRVNPKIPKQVPNITHISVSSKQK